MKISKKQFKHENTFLVTIRGNFTSGYFQFLFYQNRIKFKVLLKNRPIKVYFLLAAIWDVGGRFSHFTQDQPLSIFWTDYFKLQ